MHIKEEPNGHLHFLPQPDYRYQKLVPDQPAYYPDDHMNHPAGPFTTVFHQPGMQHMIQPPTAFGRMNEGAAFRRGSEEVVPEGAASEGAAGLHQSAWPSTGVTMDFFYGNYPQFPVLGFFIFA